MKLGLIILFYFLHVVLDALNNRILFFPDEKWNVTFTKSKWMHRYLAMFTDSWHLTKWLGQICIFLMIGIWDIWFAIAIGFLHYVWFTVFLHSIFKQKDR
jgi:hypothetical protein